MGWAGAFETAAAFDGVDASDVGSTHGVGHITSSFYVSFSALRLGLEVLKSAIFDRLARGSTIRFSNALEPVYFEQLASERRVIRYKRGQPSRRFERIPGKRAEALDALVYAHAARQAVTISFDARASELAAAPVPPPAVIRSEWMSR